MKALLVVRNNKSIDHKQPQSYQIQCKSPYFIFLYLVSQHRQLKFLIVKDQDYHLDF